MKPAHFLSATLLLLSTSAYAQSPAADKINDELSRCLKKKENQTTAGMCDCTYKALDQWDKQLNATYKAISSKLDADAKAKLIEAQRQWVKFKEKEIELIDAAYGHSEGTMWGIVRADKVLDITKQRAINLDELLTILEEFK